jgi:protein TonB
MKTQPASGKAGTFEDLIFEGRNQAYGAFELTRKRNRYLFTAFLISFAGMATSIAVPFINSLNVDPIRFVEKGPTTVILTKLPDNNVPLPPPPPDIDKMAKKLITNLAPQVVETADDVPMMTNEDWKDQSFNEPPPDLDQISEGVPDDAIPPDDEGPIIDFPTEQASFNGGDLNDFRKWISEHITYPAEAAESDVKGKVIIQFCVNKKGEVVDIMVLRSLHPMVDEATMKAISASPRWMPAKQGGNPVKTRYSIPVVFDLR